MATIDLFRSTFQLPATVCIVAPGPHGKPHYGEIPDDCAVIVVSKAALIAELPRKDVWMMNHATQDWFEAANAGFAGQRVFGAAAVREAGDWLGPELTCYSYEPPSDELTPETVHRVEGAIRYGATVSACALQLACNFGARRIVLCGVDMSGDDYFDGTQNVHVNHGEVWPAVQTIDALVRWLRAARGVHVETLSETKLDVPLYRPGRNAQDRA